MSCGVLMMCVLLGTTNSWLTVCCLCGALVPQELGQQGLHQGLDLVPDGAHGLDTLPGRVLQVPVEVLLAGEDRAGITAPHGDHHVRGLHSIGRSEEHTSELQS